MREIDIVLSTGVFILLLTLMAHDFHHDFMTLSGRVSSSVFSAASSINGGAPVDNLDMFQAVDENVDIDVEELFKKWNNTLENDYYYIINYDPSLTEMGDVSIEDDNSFNFSLIIDELVSSEIISNSETIEEKTEFYKTIVSGIDVFRLINIAINKLSISPPMSRMKGVKRSRGPISLSNTRSRNKKMKQLSDNDILSNISSMSSTRGVKRSRGPISLSNTRSRNKKIKQLFGSLKKNKKKRKKEKKAMKGKKNKKTRMKRKYSHKKKIKLTKIRRSKKVKKTNKKKTSKKSSKNKQSILKGGGARGYPVSYKVAACKKILPDLKKNVGRLDTNDNKEVTIIPKTEINEFIQNGWNEAYEQYTDILSSGVDNCPTSMDELNAYLIRLYKSKGDKFRFMGNYPLNSLPEPNGNSYTKADYESLVVQHLTSGDPSVSHKPLLCLPLTMILRTDFFDTATMVIQYEGVGNNGKKYVMDFAWYFSEKMAQLSYAVKPSFKSGMNSEEYMDSISESLHDGLNEKYKMRGSNTFARFIELIKRPLGELGINIPLFKQPVLDPTQRISLKKLGKEISKSWHSFIYGKTCDDFIKRGSSPERKALQSILKCLDKSNSNDKKIDGFMDIYFSEKGVTPATFNDSDGSLASIVSNFNAWKNVGDDKRKMVMDNAAPLGKSNWTSLYYPPGMTITRPVFLPSALDAAGSSIPDTPLSDGDNQLEYHIKDESNPGNKIILKYGGARYGGGDTTETIYMGLIINLDGNTLISEWQGMVSDLASKPLSVKNVVKNIFEKLISMSGQNIANIIQNNFDVNAMLQYITTAINLAGGKYEYYYKNLVPVVMQKLSGDFGQEVSACGGIIRGGDVYPITQTHNDIPAFIRGVLLSSMRNRQPGLQPQAPVIFQTAHSGRYLDSRP